MHIIFKQKRARWCWDASWEDTVSIKCQRSVGIDIWHAWSTKLFVIRAVVTRTLCRRYIKNWIPREEEQQDFILCCLFVFLFILPVLLVQSRDVELSSSSLATFSSHTNAWGALTPLKPRRHFGGIRTETKEWKSENSNAKVIRGRCIRV